jgi:hypothetical protein
LLSELIGVGPVERVVKEWTTPPRVRDLARKRTAELGRATAEMLQHASLFERDFTVDVLAETAGTSVSTTAALIDRAVEAHVLQPSTMHSYRFAHQLFRHALAGDLPAQQRADGHRRIAEALERRGESPGLLAAHWSAASGDVADKVCTYSLAAGRAALKLLEPHEAVSWFELARANLTDETALGSLLTELAEAQMFAGDAACVQTLQEAVDLALAAADDRMILQIVRTTTPGWSSLPGVDAAATRRLLARALEVAEDPATRSRALARFAVDLALAGSPEAESTGDEAVALARESGDRTALLESLMRRATLSMTPHTLAARRDALREVRELSSSATDAVTRYFALSANIGTAVELGEIADADALATEADAISTQYDLAPLRWSTLARRAWRAGLDGSFDAAEALIEEACRYGEAHGVSHAPEAARLQRGALRWQQGRMGEPLPAAREYHDDLGALYPGLGLLLARVLVEDPSARDEARRLLLDVAEDRFARLPAGTFWSSALVVSAETAYLLGAGDVCETIRDLLLPFVDQVSFNGLWVVAPIAYGAGVAAAGCGDPEAHRYLERAAAIANRMHAPALAARALSPGLTATG